jgi:pimeloyl-ACP methyl ester carboxylesterase
MVVLAMVPVASAWQARAASANQGAAPVLDLQAHEQPPENMRELAEKIMEITIREEGQYRPIEFVRIGEDEYLILISGTQLDSPGGNNPESAAQEMTRESSPYLRQIRALIKEHIPAGSRLHFAGHSLGGMVANTLAARPELLDEYTVVTVTTFASPVNACPNPDVAYQRYIVEGDLIPLLHWAAIWSRLEGPLGVLRSSCEQGYEYLDQTIVDHRARPDGVRNSAHSSYQFSQDLAELPLPFAVGRYEPMGRFEAEPQRR